MIPCLLRSLPPPQVCSHYNNIHLQYTHTPWKYKFSPFNLIDGFIHSWKVTILHLQHVFIILHLTNSHHRLWKILAVRLNYLCTRPSFLVWWKRFLCSHQSCSRERLNFLSALVQGYIKLFIKCPWSMLPSLQLQVFGFLMDRWLSHLSSDTVSAELSPASCLSL